MTIAEGPRPTADARIAERRLGTAARTVVERMAGEPYDGVAGIHLVLADALLDAPDLLREPIAPLLRGAPIGRAGGLREPGGPAGERLGRIAAGSSTPTWASDDEDDWDDVDLSDAADVGDDPDEPPSLAETLAEISERFDLDAREEKAVELFLVALQLEAAEAPMTDPDTLQAFVRALQNPLIAEIIAAEAWQQASVGPFATRLLAAAEPGTTAGVRYVLAIDADADDDPDRAEQHLLAALGEDPAFVPALDALATLAEERGDLAEALRLLKRAGVPASDPGRAELERVLAPEGRKVGRNEPCPCGSGRKSKACHPDGVGAVALSDGRLLRWIVGVWSERPEVETGAHELLADAGFRPDHDVPEGGDEDSPVEDARWSTAHGLATDIILYDDGDLADLLRSRGHRLPPDLLPLAGAWLRTERTLLEVRAITPDRGITVRDLLHDRLLTLEDPLLFRGIRLQELLCARPLPDGQGGHVVQSGLRRAPIQTASDCSPCSERGTAWRCWSGSPPLSPGVTDRAAAAPGTSGSGGRSRSPAARPAPGPSPRSAGRWCQAPDASGARSCPAPLRAARSTRSHRPSGGR